MFSYFEPNFIEKLFWESVFFFFFFFFQILAKLETTRNKNRLFGRHFETVQIFFFKISGIMVSDIAYIYGANFNAKFRWKIGFLRGFHGTPLGHQRTLVT